MDRVSGGMKGYDFKAARDRIIELTGLYRLAKHSEDEGAQWEIMAQIDEIEREIQEAHASGNAKMTAVSGSGHPVMHITNLIAPIVPQWAEEHKGARP